MPTVSYLLKSEQVSLRNSSLANDHNFVSGSFEIALIRACRAIDPTTRSVAFGDDFIPIDCFAALGLYCTKFL